MTFSNIGDLARSYQNRMQNTQIKSDLTRMSQELASGRKSDASTGNARDFAPLAAIKNSLSVLASYTVATSEAGFLATNMQNALGQVQGTASEMGAVFLATSSAGHATMIDATAVDARTKFGSVVSTLNTQMAGQSLFSGVATDRKPLAGSETMLASLATAIAAETTAAGVVSILDDWFNLAGGGFDSVAYQGSSQPLSPIPLSNTDTAILTITAANSELRDTMKSLASVALIDLGALSGNKVEQVALARWAGENLLSAESGIVGLRSTVGTVQAKIDTVASRNAAQVNSFEHAFSDLTSIDPYRVATELEATTTQLETLYTLTARMSRLNLSDFLR